MSQKDQTPKDPMPEDEFQALNEAWHQSEQMDPADRDDFRKFLQFKHAKLLEQYDRPAENGDETLSGMGKFALGALDYGAGLVRTPIAALGAGLVGRGDLVHAQDFKDALNPFDGRPAPSSAEWLKRGNVPEGGHLSEALPSWYSETGDEWTKFKKGGPLDPSARDALGLFLDVGTSLPALRGAGRGALAMKNPEAAALAERLSEPELAQLKKLASQKPDLTAIQKLRQAAFGPDISKSSAADISAAVQGAAKEAAMKKPPGLLKKLGNLGVGTAKFAMDPIDYTLSKGGRAVYNSAFKDADTVAKANGGRAVSDIMFQEGVTGDPHDLLTAADHIRTRRAAANKAIIDDVNAKTPTASIKYRPGESRTVFSMEGFDAPDAPAPAPGQPALPPGRAGAPAVGQAPAAPALTDSYPTPVTQPARGVTPGSAGETAVARNTAVGPNRTGVGPGSAREGIVLDAEPVASGAAPKDDLADILMTGKSQYTPGSFQVDPNTGLRVPLGRVYAPTLDMLRKARKVIGTGAEARSAWDTIAQERFAADPFLRKQSLNLDELLDMKNAYQERAKIAGAYGHNPSNPAATVKLQVDNPIEAGITGKAYKRIAQSAREAAEGLVDEVNPGQGGTMHLNNRDIGSLLEAERSMIRSTQNQKGVWRQMWTRDPGMGFRTGVGMKATQVAPWLSALGRGGLVEKYGEDARKLSPYDQLMLEMQQLNQGK